MDLMKLMKCPRCHGSTWDPETGEDCLVCNGTGALNKTDEPVEWDRAREFLDWMEEQKRAEKYGV